MISSSPLIHVSLYKCICFGESLSLNFCVCNSFYIWFQHQEELEHKAKAEEERKKREAEERKKRIDRGEEVEEEDEGIV